LNWPTSVRSDADRSTLIELELKAAAGMRQDAVAHSDRLVLEAEDERKSVIDRLKLGRIESSR
jgi:hypothetical protein